jgi:hypothetical protein
MNNWQMLRVGVAGFAEFLGGLFVLAAIYYAYAYVVESDNPMRHEYSFGIGVGLLYGFGALLVAAFLAISVKRVISRNLFLVLSVPALIVGVVVLGLYLYSVGVDVLANKT